eukprot:7227436-Prymnesium_polylepis.1
MASASVVAVLHPTSPSRTIHGLKKSFCAATHSTFQSVGGRRASCSPPGGGSETLPLVGSRRLRASNARRCSSEGPVCCVNSAKPHVLWTRAGVASTPYTARSSLHQISFHGLDFADVSDRANCAHSARYRDMRWIWPSPPSSVGWRACLYEMGGLRPKSARSRTCCGLPISASIRVDTWTLPWYQSLDANAPASSATRADSCMSTRALFIFCSTR